MESDWQQQLQQLYFSDTETPKVLDARPKTAYVKQRLRGAANVDLLHLTERCFLLPDKPTPFAVLVPSQCQYTVVTDASSHGQQLSDGSIAVYLKGTRSLKDFLDSRGWTVTHYLLDSPYLWQAAVELGLLDTQQEDPQLLATRCLFSPSELLSNSIAHVEASLAARHLCQTGQERQQHNQHQQLQDTQQQALAGSHHVDSSRRMPQQVTLRALDVGCGSGRDTAWLASRQHSVTTPTNTSSPQQPAVGVHAPKERQQSDVAADQVQVSWHVTGLDEWSGALERAHELATALQLSPQQIQLVYGAVSKDTGDIQLLRLPAKSKLWDADNAAIVHAGMCQPGPAVVAAASHQQLLSNTAVQQQATKCTCDGNSQEQSDHSMPHWIGRFDLVLCVRFLERSLLPLLSAMLNPGGFILYSTFVDGPGLRAFGRPSGPDHVLQPGELASRYFGPNQGFEVLEDRVVVTGDVRELCYFVAQRCS